MSNIEQWPTQQRGMLTPSQLANRLARRLRVKQTPQYWQELQMSEVYARPEPSLIPIPRPLCPACKRRMMLVRIGSSCNGPDLRIFECTSCGEVCGRPAEDPVTSAK